MLQDKERYEEPIRESLKALLALGWKLDLSEAVRSSLPRSTKTVSWYLRSFPFMIIVCSAEPNEVIFLSIY